MDSMCDESSGTFQLDVSNIRMKKGRAPEASVDYSLSLQLASFLIGLLD